MRTEGRGEVEPSPVCVRLDRTDMIVAKEWATTQAMARRYSERRDTWGKGMIPGRHVRNVGDVRDGEMPAFVGKLGEIAFVYFINGILRSSLLHVDFTERARGDGGSDIELYGFRIDIKTSSSGLKCLIRKTRKDGRIVPLEAHRYVFAAVDREMPSIVQLLGWIDRSRVLTCPVVDSPFGHANYQIPRAMLESMTSLSCLAKGGS